MPSSSSCRWGGFLGGISGGFGLDFVLTTFAVAGFKAAGVGFPAAGCFDSLDFQGGAMLAVGMTALRE
jgi:hypothetical protein